jgi:hypothetical protein
LHFLVSLPIFPVHLATSKHTYFVAKMLPKRGWANGARKTYRPEADFIKHRSEKGASGHLGYFDGWR